MLELQGSSSKSPEPEWVVAMQLGLPSPHIPVPHQLKNSGPLNKKGNLRNLDTCMAQGLHESQLLYIAFTFQRQHLLLCLLQLVPCHSSTPSCVPSCFSRNLFPCAQWNLCDCSLHEGIFPVSEWIGLKQAISPGPSASDVQTYAEGAPFAKVSTVHIC